MGTIKVGDTFALVNDEDMAWLLAKHSWWFLASRRYAATRTHRKGRDIFMHRVIMDPPKGMYIDHINHDTLDNRRENLRIVTHAQNMANQRPVRGLKGVDYKEKNRKWQARICVDGVQRYLGLYATEEEAGAVYDTAAIKAWGEYAYTNAQIRDGR